MPFVAAPDPAPLDLAEVRAIALGAGADDAGAVSLDEPSLSSERPHVLAAFPKARTLISVVLREHPNDIRSPTRSVANLEFHRTGAETDEVCRRIAVELDRRGHPSVNPPMAFPMEMDSFPGRTWVVSHKRVAEAAQLGRMGLHRSVIHPRFGSFILLGTVITASPLAEAPAPLAGGNPCISCKLCVAACPVGAIEPTGGFRFSACYDHNYREFMTGFSDYVEEVADSRGRQDFRDRVPLSETVRTWQGLAFGPSYNAAYCIAVCPAGSEVVPDYAQRRAAHLEDVVRPLTARVEPVYVVKDSDAEVHVRKRFPHKRVRAVRSSLRPTSVSGFFAGLPLSFQRGPARGWAATFHFALDGDERTVRIDDGTLAVSSGLDGEPDVAVSGQGAAWLDVVSKRRHPVLQVLLRRLRISGDRQLLQRFAACFPR